MTSPLCSERKRRCSRNSSAPRTAAALAHLAPVASEYSCSPHVGASDSWNDERRPVARGSQFQPPSGHCHSTSDRASSSTRGSSAIPSREHTASELPSCEAQRRTRPSMTLMPCRWPAPVSQSSTVSAAARARASPGGMPSSTRATRRQCAPPHFLYGWPPKPPPASCPRRSALTIGPARIASGSGSRRSPMTSRRVRYATAGSVDARSQSTAGPASTCSVAVLTDRSLLLLGTGNVDVAGAKRRHVTRRRIVGVSPDAAGVVREQVDRDRGRGRCRAHPVDVVLGRNQHVEVPARERARLHDYELAVVAQCVDLLLLCAAVEADETPGKMIVNGGLRPRRDDEAEQRQRRVAGAKEQPLADAAAHPGLGRGLLEALGEPPVRREQLGEARSDQLARGGRGKRLLD